MPSEDAWRKRYLLIADGTNNEVRIVERATGEKIGSFGRPDARPAISAGYTTSRSTPEGSRYTSEVDTGKRRNDSAAYSSQRRWRGQMRLAGWFG